MRVGCGSRARRAEAGRDRADLSAPIDRTDVLRSPLQVADELRSGVCVRIDRSPARVPAGFKFNELGADGRAAPHRDRPPADLRREQSQERAADTAREKQLDPAPCMAVGIDQM